MTALDAVLLAVLAVFALRGFFRGFVRETAGLLALVGALLGTALYAGPLSEALLAREVVPAELALLAAGAVLFVGIYLAATLLGRGLDRMARALLPPSVVRGAGVAFAVAKGAAILGFALILGQQWAPILLSEERVESSRLAPPMLRLARALISESGDWMGAPTARASGRVAG